MAMSGRKSHGIAHQMKMKELEANKKDKENKMKEVKSVITNEEDKRRIEMLKNIGVLK